MVAPLKIHETDSTGRLPTAIYLVDSTTSPATTAESHSFTTRIDVLPATRPVHTQTTAVNSVLVQLLTPFLPAGYPSTVTADYTPYQIYDSLQAFASTIAGLLTSRAVLVGMGVGSENASATTATLLSIAQESIGRLATIFFAHAFSQRIEAEVKYYRFLADIVNDAAFVLDCLSPGLPPLARMPALCVSSACRAVCGVAGGSSKAILSAHFAKAGNIGELNAKDGSQETVVSLLGMWVGGLVVSRVHGIVETWVWLLALLGMHLWANWMAVRSVRLTVLNKGRTAIVLEGLMKGVTMGVQEVGQREEILARRADMVLRGKDGEVLASCRVGASFKDMTICMGGQISDGPAGCITLGSDLDALLTVFDEERYLLWYDAPTRRIVVVLKENAMGGDTQLKSVYHAMRLLQMFWPEIPPSLGPQMLTSNHGQERKWQKTQADPSHSRTQQTTLIKLLRKSLEASNAEWKRTRLLLEQAGWEVSKTNVEVDQGRRVRLSHHAKNE